MDERIASSVFSLKNDEFDSFVYGLVGQQIVDIMKFQSITSTQSFIRNPDVFAMFNIKCSDSNFLSLRKRSCFELEDGRFVVKIGLMNNLNNLLDVLKGTEKSITMKDRSATESSDISMDFINRHSLLKNLCFWYQTVIGDDTDASKKYRLLPDFIDTITTNLTKSKSRFRYNDNIRNFAVRLYILGGKVTYEYVRLNLPGSLPNLTTLNTLILNSTSTINEAEFRFNQLQQHFEKLHVQYAFGSEDTTGVIRKIKYDSSRNTFCGFSTPLDNGVPVKDHYKTM